MDMVAGILKELITHMSAFPELAHQGTPIDAQVGAPIIYYTIYDHYFLIAPYFIIEQ